MKLRGLNAGLVAQPLAMGTAGHRQLSRTQPQIHRWQQLPQQQRCRHQRARGGVSVRATPGPPAVGIKLTEDEIDMRKLEDREQWYIARFCADDAPDWNEARFIRSEPLAKGLQKLVLEVEISREKVPIRNGYRHVGQRARVRVNSGVEYELQVSSPPFALMRNKDPLFKARGDISSGEIKLVKEVLSVTGHVELVVPEGEAPDLFKAGEGDAWEAGPFAGAGMNLRGPLIGMYNYPTIVIFCEGLGIAAAKALIEATAGVGGLSFPLRRDVRMYYRAPNDASLAYRELWPVWEEKYRCKVISATRDSFQDMFDDDLTLEYEPVQTAAIILTGGDEEAEQAALAVCKEAEITEVAKESDEQVKTEYLTMGTNM